MKRVSILGLFSKWNHFIPLLSTIDIMNDHLPHRAALFEKLEEAKFWLSHQEGMADWEAGRERIAERLETLIALYEEEFWLKPHLLNKANYSELLVELWGRWEYAWYGCFKHNRANCTPEEILKESQEKGMGWTWTQHFYDVLLVAVYSHFNNHQAYDIIDKNNTDRLVNGFMRLVSGWDKAGTASGLLAWQQKRPDKEEVKTKIISIYGDFIRSKTWKNFAGSGALFSWLIANIKFPLKKEFIGISSKNEKTGKCHPNPKEAVSLPEEPLPNPNNPLSPLDGMILNDCNKALLKALQEMSRNHKEALGFIMFYKKAFECEVKKRLERNEADGPGKIQGRVTVSFATAIAYGFSEEVGQNRFYHLRSMSFGLLADLTIRYLVPENRPINEEINDVASCQRAIIEFFLTRDIPGIKKQEDVVDFDWLE